MNESCVASLVNLRVYLCMHANGLGWIDALLLRLKRPSSVLSLLLCCAAMMIPTTLMTQMTMMVVLLCDACGCCWLLLLLCSSSHQRTNYGVLFARDFDTHTPVSSFRLLPLVQSN